MMMKKYQEILDVVLSVPLPECDLDQYTSQLGVDAKTYANNFATSFLTTQNFLMPGMEEEGTASSRTDMTPMLSTSDGQNLSQ